MSRASGKVTMGEGVTSSNEEDTIYIYMNKCIIRSSIGSDWLPIIIMNKCYFIIHQLYLQVAAGCHQFPLVVVEVPMVEVAMMLMVELFVLMVAFVTAQYFYISRYATIANT